MTPTVLAEYNESLKGTPVLGHIVFYGVERLQVKWTELKKLLEDLDLGAYVPSAPADVDVFRRVATAAQVQRISTDDPGIYVNILVRDVAGDDKVVVKRIVAEEVNPAGKRLRYTETHDLVFHRDIYNRATDSTVQPYARALEQLETDLERYTAAQPEGWEPDKDPSVAKMRADIATAKATLDSVLRRLGNVEVVTLVDRNTGMKVDEVEHPAACAAADAILPAYAAAIGTVDANAVRSLMCRILDKIHAVRLRKTGGVFFVPQAHTRIVDGLCEFANLVPGAEFHPAPLIDTARQREMVKRSFETEVTAEIDAKIAEVTSLLEKGEKVSARKMRSIMEDFEAAQDKLDAYAGLLEDKLAGTDSRLDVFQQAMQRLLRLGRSSDTESAA